MRVRLLVIFVAVAAAFVGRAATLAEADDIQLNLKLRGKGSLSIGHGTVPKATSTLDGSDQVVTFVMPITLTDARGTGDGWSTSVTSTTFDDGSGDTLAEDAASVSAVDVSCDAGGQCTAPASAVSYPLPVPAGATAPAATVFFDAGSGTGMGAFELDTSVDVTIPGNTYAGKYKSTMTFTAATGP